MLYVRCVILNILPEVVVSYSFRFPFYIIENKPMLYLNVLKGKDYVVIAFVHGVVLKKDFHVLLRNDRNRKQLCSIQLKSLEGLNQENFKELLCAAAKLVKETKRPWHI